MLEKLLLAITITFSLNLFLEVRVPEHPNTGANYHHQAEPTSTVLVNLLQK